jgi:hypothetical protein
VLAVAGVVVLGAVMSILDTTVVNVAINTLARDFDTSLSTIQWVVTGYTLALATVIPLTGWGRRPLRHQAPVHDLDRAVPILLGPILGPILGGWLVDDVSWRWIFFINLPIGIVALFLSLRILPKDRPEPSERLDVLGLALLSPSLALIIYGLAQTTAHGFASAAVLVPALVGVVLLASFIWHALHVSNPLIDLRLFANRTFSTASITLALMVISVFGLRAAQHRPVRHGPWHGPGDDAAVLRRHADAAQGRGRPRLDDAEHHPAGRGLDRRRRDDGDPHVLAGQRRPGALVGRRVRPHLHLRDGVRRDRVRRRLVPAAAQARAHRGRGGGRRHRARADARVAVSMSLRTWSDRV